MTASGRFISVGSCWDGSTNGTASFVDSRNAHGLWKLPEPWTPRTRPPLLAKRADAFRTATTGPLPGDLQSTSVTHVPGLLCYRCSRLHPGGRSRQVNMEFPCPSFRIGIDRVLGNISRTLEVQAISVRVSERCDP